MAGLVLAFTQPEERPRPRPISNDTRRESLQLVQILTQLALQRPEAIPFVASVAARFLET
jgi:hypothetical protein